MCSVLPLLPFLFQFRLHPSTGGNHLHDPLQSAGLRGALRIFVHFTRMPTVTKMPHQAANAQTAKFDGLLVGSRDGRISHWNLEAQKNREMSRFRFTFGLPSIFIGCGWRRCKFPTVSFLPAASRATYASAYIMVIGSCACWRWGICYGYDCYEVPGACRWLQ